MRLALTYGTSANLPGPRKGCSLAVGTANGFPNNQMTSSENQPHKSKWCKLLLGKLAVIGTEPSPAQRGSASCAGLA
eukprot:1096480-Heterocapsa_arctica.AAC.1